ncbi:DUF5009 domain-containing protein [Fulvivirga sp.]|uniref:acyltransferase family protein n=1 Tax=Fulvivirga sp. TaxID=1931237 RepID=UPI0032EEA7BF
MNKKPRYLSLDVFRGATVCLMITVNNPGEWGIQYGSLQHAQWHGLTLTDMVFPAFLFAVGNAMAFAMEKYEQQGNATFWKKILKRSFIIFLIGYLLQWFPFYDFGSGSAIPVSAVRIPGVLQRIALCYLMASVLIHYCSKRQVIGISLLILLGYWFVLFLFGAAPDPFSITSYIGNAIDISVFGAERIYNGEGLPFDPEGLLSTLPAVVNVVLGYFTGMYIRKQNHSYETIAKLMLVGGGMILTALFWDLFFPINKKIWTSSYTIITSGICMSLLAMLIYLIEIKQVKHWTYFFEVFGRNPLFIYILSWVLATLYYTIRVEEESLIGQVMEGLQYYMTPANASLLFAILFTLLNWFIGYVMDKRKIYVKV